MKQNFQPEEDTQNMAQHTARKKAGADRKTAARSAAEQDPRNAANNVEAAAAQGVPSSVPAARLRAC